MTWLTSLFAGIQGLLISAGISIVLGIGGGYYLAHKLDSIPYNALVASKATLQSQYDGYRATVATASATADAKANKQLNDLQSRYNALQAQLLDSQRIADAKSKSLQALLAAAKPGDIRPIGPVASTYYDSLRTGSAPAGQPASAGNP